MREDIKVEVDLNRELIFNLDINDLNQFDIIDDRIINKDTKVKPCILHANGGTYNDMMLNEPIKSIWV